MVDERGFRKILWLTNNNKCYKMQLEYSCMRGGTIADEQIRKGKGAYTTAT